MRAIPYSAKRRGTRAMGESLSAGARRKTGRKANRHQRGAQERRCGDRTSLAPSQVMNRIAQRAAGRALTTRRDE
jgi:hypothetical protein